MASGQKSPLTTKASNFRYGRKADVCDSSPDGPTLANPTVRPGGNYARFTPESGHGAESSASSFHDPERGRVLRLGPVIFHYGHPLWHPRNHRVLSKEHGLDVTA